VFQIINQLKEEHTDLNSILSDIFNTEFCAENRKTLFITLRDNLNAHTEFELQNFYDVLRQNPQIDIRLRDVFENDLAASHKQVLYRLETIIDFNHENEDDLMFLQEMISARIGIEEDVLFPVFKKFCV
jgi:hypothetical protein